MSRGATWRYESGLTLAKVMAYCLTAPSHYLNQRWLIINKILVFIPRCCLLEYSRYHLKAVFGILTLNSQPHLPEGRQWFKMFVQLIQSITLAYLGHGKKLIPLIHLGEILIRPGRLCIPPRWITAYSTREDNIIFRPGGTLFCLAGILVRPAEMLLFRPGGLDSGPTSFSTRVDYYFAQADYLFHPGGLSFGQVGLYTILPRRNNNNPPRWNY